MIFEGMTPEEKLNFLDVLIEKTDPKLKEHFYAIYLVIGDDIFLLFSMLSGFSVNFANERAFSQARSSALAAAGKKLAREIKPGIVRTVTEFHEVKVLDLESLPNQNFVHIDLNEPVSVRDLQKQEVYFCEGIDAAIYVIAKPREVFGRTYLLYADPGSLAPDTKVSLG